MSRELFEKRKLEFLKTITKTGNLPKVWEVRFTDGDDQRLWFNKISKLEEFKDYINEVNTLLNNYNTHILTDIEREEEFIKCIKQIKRIPMRSECYFSDNLDMNMWFLNYRIKNKEFETTVHNNLPEFRDFFLEEVWSFVKKDFIETIKNLKRIPRHGEAKLLNDIDVRTIYDKLETYNPEFFEKLLLHLKTYNKKGLSIDDRIEELKQVVIFLGRIPELQEYRFSDDTDMFTWYKKYEKIITKLNLEILPLIKEEQDIKKVNIYLIPTFKKTGGKFYTICTNVGERLDLTNIETYEEAKQIDNSFTKKGGLILKKDEEIATVNFVKGKSK